MDGSYTCEAELSYTYIGICWTPNQVRSQYDVRTSFAEEGLQGRQPSSIDCI